MFNIRLVLCDEDEPVAICLTLCDLAGSVNPSKTGNMGSRLREAGCINTSLLVLGRCLEALQLGKGAEQRAPFRDSKLTQVGGGISASVTGFRAAGTLISLPHSIRYRVRKLVFRWSFNEAYKIAQVQLYMLRFCLLPAVAGFSQPWKES